MGISDNAYGGFVISKNVNKDRPIRYSYREESSLPQLNGWTIYSCDDSDEYEGSLKDLGYRPGYHILLLIVLLNSFSFHAFCNISFIGHCYQLYETLYSPPNFNPIESDMFRNLSRF